MLNKHSVPPANKRLPHAKAIIDDFSSAPFRLFFLSGCFVGVLAASCWALATMGWLQVDTDPLNLHIFLFLQAFAGIAYAGFLFTAIPEWTHNNTNLKPFMQLLWCLCLLALIVASWSLRWGLTIMVLYWLSVFCLASSLVWQRRDSRHISVLTFVGATALLTLWLAYNAWFTLLTPFQWQQLLHIEVMGVALITFRISKVLGTQALEDDGQIDSLFIPNPFYKNLAVWLFYVLVVVNVLLHNTIIEGWLSLAIGGVMIGRLREWHFWVLLKRHYVRWLYTCLFIIGIGYAWRGLALIGVSQSPLFAPVLPFHLIAIGGLVLMVYQVFNIAGLRHSHQVLIFPTTSRIGLSCILLAAISRTLAVGLGANYLWFALYVPGLLLSCAFVMYAVVFYPLFMRYPATTPD